MSRKSAVSAIERGHLSELQHVLEESEWDIGSEPLDSEGQTALHIACTNGHLDIVQYLVNRKGCSVTVKDMYGHRPLMLSIINNYWKMANFLLKITPDFVINELGLTFASYNISIVMELAKEALIESCKEGYFELVNYLIKSGWYRPTVDHKEIIKLARCFDNLHIVKHLLTHCQCTMPDDMSEVHIACIQGVVKKVKMALDSNGSSLLGTADHYSTTPIHYATLEPNLLKMIVKYAGEKLLNITDSSGNTPLHHSIKYECTESVIILVGVPGCDVNLANLKGETPLIAACKYSNSDIVKLLLKCEINTSDSEGNTALHIAASSNSSGRLENMHCLLQSDRCDPNVINKSGHTPLHIVCFRHDFSLIEALVADKRCDLNIQDGNGDTALHIGVENAEIVKGILESGRSRCNIYNEMGLTPFHKAIVNGVMPSVKVMLKNGVNILQTCKDEFQNAPIHIACEYSRLDILKILLGCTNCNPNQQNAVGDTALNIVCRMRTGSELQFLKVLTSTPGINLTLENHKGIAPCDVVGIDGNTLLHIACAKGNTAIVELLIKNGANVLKHNGDGDASIHIACKHSRLDILKQLLNSCNPDQQNAHEDTPLQILSRRGGNNEQMKKNSKMAKLLLKNGANELKLDRHGDAPIHIACKHSRLHILRELVALGSCTLNQQNAKGNTALHIVCGMRIRNTLQFLEVLSSTPGINLTLVNHEGLTPFEVVDGDGNTLLHNACAKGNFPLVEYLVRNGADVLKPDRHGDAPIHIACKYSRLDILKVLLGYTNCNPNQQNAKRDTALNIVYRMRTGNELQFFEVLTSTPGINLTLENHKGIPPCDVVGIDGNTLLHIACAKGNTAIVELLIKNGANVLKHNGDGDASIHIACKHSRLDILKQLLNSCNPDQQNVHEDTPLQILSRRGGNNEQMKKSSKMAKLLLENGADVLKLDRYGDAPIHIACKYSRLDTLKVLLGFKPCDPNQQNASGDTALHIVCRMRIDDVHKYFQLLISRPELNTKIVNHNDQVPFDVVDNDGKTLLHRTCAEGDTRMAMLLVQIGENILKCNRYGDAPIHIVCKHGRIDLLKFILNCTNCDPNQQNARGDTALHIVCRMRIDDVHKYFQLLISRPEINAKIVNHNNQVPFDIVDNDGNTLLHRACVEGDTRMAMLLVKNGENILKCNRHGDAPIHIACKHGRIDLLKFILNSTNCDPNQQNAKGDTALHIVCRKKFSNEKQLLNTLTSVVGIDPEIVNNEGRTPIEAAGINYSAIATIEKFLEYKKSSIQAYLKIFVVGNSGNGKSTLIKAVTTEASQLLKYTPLSKRKYVNPSDVLPLTAGIVPTPFSSKHFGNAVLYDFAGQHEYYSSHAAVMENLILPSPPLFLLLINISKSKEEIKEELVYWWHFINNQSQKAAAPPHVILAGSHKDMVKSGDREEIETMIRDCIKRLPVTFKFVSYFPLDCRKLVSQGLSALFILLRATCQTLRGIVNVNLHCHILNALLRAPEFQDLVYCKLVDIIDKIESDDTLLPKALPQLIPLLESLNDQGYILLLKNPTYESKSWVILKPDVLLAEVNGSVFAPKYFKEHSEFAMSTGVVTLSKLKGKFTEYSHEVIAAYLTHLEFCFRIRDQHTLDMITKNEIHESTTEEYFFFPSLVSVENPTDVCQPHQSIGYECGWLYKCSKETEQLTTRFLHVLILRLAFACEPPDDPTETDSVVLLRSCSVWKHGIAWWTNDGIEVIVEVGLQCRWVAVMLRCPDAKKVECAELRSKVIHTVLKAKTDFCPAITMREYLIAPSSLKYPFEGRELTLYSMREVARATIEGKDYARDTEGKNLISTPQLLPFEPYHNMGNLVPKFFSGDTSVAVTQQEVTQVAEKCHDKLAELKTAFKPGVGSFQRECVKAYCTEVERCVALFHILQRRGHFKTWRDFQQEFSRFTIFCEQSPLVRMIISMLNTHLNPDPVECRIQQTSLCFLVMRF